MKLGIKMFSNSEIRPGGGGGRRRFKDDKKWKKGKLTTSNLITKAYKGILFIRITPPIIQAPRETIRHLETQGREA